MSYNKVYRNVCWFCNNAISSNSNKRCPHCGWYICAVCGSCSRHCKGNKKSKNDILKYEKLYKKIFTFTDLEDMSTFKVRVCKSFYKIKTGTTQAYYDCSENLGEFDGISYISDNSPLGIWLFKNDIGAIFYHYSDGKSTKFKLMKSNDYINQNQSK